MTSPNKSVAMYEFLGLFAWLGAREPDTVFFGSKSMSVRWAERLLPRVRSEAREISYGDVEKAHALRSVAYRRALERSADVAYDLRSLAQIGSSLGIDMELLIRKFLVETLFKRYEFLGLSRQYAAEHPGVETRLIAAPLFGEELSPNASAAFPWPLGRLSYFGALLVLPLYGMLFALRNQRDDRPPISDAVICEVDTPKIQSMFNDLFGTDVQYVAERHYMSNFESTKAAHISAHGIGRRGLKRIRRTTTLFFLKGLLNARRLSRYGDLIFGLYSTMIRGILLVPEAKRSLYLAYEHLFTTKAVRNEFMRADGNKTVSFPYGTHADSHFFAPAYRYNYDLLCAAGPLQERIYALQQATTKVVLPSGPYESQKLEHGDSARSDRVRRLLERKVAETSITILSSGIQDQTRSGEIKLMALARQLAAEPDVCVFYRPKPVAPPEKYKTFYLDGCAGSDRLILTSPEYKLTDFLDVTDLFVTFWSHSGADLCAAGAQVFTVDFMEDEAVPLWQTVVEGCFLDERRAFQIIMDWVRDVPNGARAAHAARMTELRRLLAYEFDSFGAYKDNLIRQLSPHMSRGKGLEAQRGQ